MPLSPSPISRLRHPALAVFLFVSMGVFLSLEARPPASSKAGLVLEALPPGGAGNLARRRKGRVFALVIGVGRFQDKGIPPLQYAGKDAQAFADWLLASGLPASHLRLLVEEKATYKAVGEALTTWLTAKAPGPNDSLFLFFSGHGLKDGQLYWLLHDSQRDSLAFSALGRDRLHQSVSRFAVRNQVWFVDACFSRAISSDLLAASKSLLLSNEHLQNFKGQGRFVLTSSDGNQESLEPKGLGHGLFTHYLLRALKGEGDANGDRILTATELYNYVEEQVRLHAARLHRTQQPAKDDQTVGGELALLRLPSPSEAATEPSAPPREVPAAATTRLRVESSPSGAAVYLDDAKEGRTPWEGEVEPGRRTLEVKLDGYASVKEVLRLRPRTRRTESYTLRSLAPSADRPAEPAPIVTAVEPSPASPKAGDRQTFEAKGVTFAMRFIPAGSFTMGSPADEKQRDSDEGPQRTVRLSRAFWMLETEVTQGQYKALVGSNPSNFSSCGDTCPVEKVSWHDAAAFANTLSTQQNLPSCFTCKANGECDIPDKAAYLACKGWRLPTEAEWEYAARAGTTTRFHTGDCITPDQANFDSRYPPKGCPKGEDRVKTVVVGSFAANAWGLHDMHGNVWEWVADWKETYDSNDLGDPLQLLGSDPRRRSSRVLRGGSWDGDGRRLRSAYRNWVGPAGRGDSLGFRLSRSR